MKNKSSIVHRQLSILLILISLFFILLSGCQSSQQAAKKAEPAVAAVWESPAGQNHWKFTLLEDGTISEAHRPDGLKMNIEKGGEVANFEDSILYYIYGPCTWTYKDDTSILRVAITIDDFFVETKEGKLHYKITDEFEGPVSKDGSTWTPQWKTTTNYDPPIPEQVVEGRELIFSTVQ